MFAVAETTIASTLLIARVGKRLRFAFRLSQTVAGLLTKVYSSPTTEASE